MITISSKINTELYTQFLLANQKTFSACWLAELLDNCPAHDSVTRWLAKSKLQPKLLWKYAKPMVDATNGYLVLDDSIYDKWYAPKNELAKFQYSGTHHRKVRGICVVTLLWNSEQKPETAQHIPVDYRIYSKKYDGYTKNQHFRHMLETAFFRDFVPEAVLFDAWYSSLDNLKLIRSLGWTFIGGIHKDRHVSLVPREHRRVDSLTIPKNGLICHLKGFGQVKIFKIVRAKTDIDYIATNDVSLTFPDIRNAAARRWKIEEYHQGVKQTTGAESCPARRQRIQRNHLFCSFLAFLALEKQRLKTGVSWYRSQKDIVKEAIMRYMENPLIPLPKPVT